MADPRQKELLSHPFITKNVNPNHRNPIAMFDESLYPRIVSTSNPHQWSLIPVESYYNESDRITVLADSWPNKPKAILDPYCYYPKSKVMKREFWIPLTPVSRDINTAKFVYHPRLTPTSPYEYQFEFDGSGNGRYGVAIAHRNGNGKVFYTVASDSKAGPEVKHHIHQEAEGLEECLNIAEYREMTSFRLLGDSGDLINFITGPNGPNHTKDEKKFGQVTCNYIRKIRTRYRNLIQNPAYLVTLRQVYREAIPVADHLCRYKKRVIGGVEQPREERSSYDQLRPLTDTTQFMNARYESDFPFLRFPINLLPSYLM